MSSLNVGPGSSEMSELVNLSYHIPHVGLGNASVLGALPSIGTANMPNSNFVARAAMQRLGNQKGRNEPAVCG